MYTVPFAVLGPAAGYLGGTLDVLALGHLDIWRQNTRPQTVGVESQYMYQLTLCSHMCNNKCGASRAPWRLQTANEAMAPHPKQETGKR